MTASVVVMNSGAVALAADSAVTVPHGSGMKHYQGACKLVASHTEAPIAMLWYGSPDHLGVPWEVVIKDYRRQRTARLPEVVDYASDFLEYLDAEWVPHDDGEPPAAALARDLLARVEKSLSRRTVDPSATIDDEIKAWRRSLQPRQRILEDAEVDGCERLTQWLEDELSRIDEVTDGLPKAAGERLRGAARSAWTHLSAREPLHSGLVFAGFGERNRLPAMCSYLLGLPVEGKPRRAKGAYVLVTSKFPAQIIPFAQNDLVRMFMEGLHPTLRKFMADMLGELSEMLDVDDPFVERMKRLLGNHIDDHGRPVVDAVRFLPKADLAEFARALISFTAFRLRMSMSPETVGEPIDVAVVSRSEGVVWVHRNHYFPAYLNPRFYSRYGAIMPPDATE
jgi:hypothetical protein